MNNEMLNRMLQDAHTNQAAGGAEGTVLLAYKQAKNTDGDILDFNDPFNARQVRHITEILDAAGISEFTVSSECSNMMDTFWAIQQAGWHTMGMRQVLSPVKDWEPGTYPLIPAWHFTRTH